MELTKLAIFLIGIIFMSLIPNLPIIHSSYADCDPSQPTAYNPFGCESTPDGSSQPPDASSQPPGPSPYPNDINNDLEILDPSIPGKGGKDQNPEPHVTCKSKTENYFAGIGCTPDVCSEGEVYIKDNKDVGGCTIIYTMEGECPEGMIHVKGGCVQYYYYSVDSCDDNYDGNAQAYPSSLSTHPKYAQINSFHSSNEGYISSFGNEHVTNDILKFVPIQYTPGEDSFVSSDTEDSGTEDTDTEDTYTEDSDTEDSFVSSDTEDTYTEDSDTEDTYTEDSDTEDSFVSSGTEDSFVSSSVAGNNTSGEKSQIKFGTSSYSISKEDQSILDKLHKLADAANKEGNIKFQVAVNEFIIDLSNMIQSNPNDPSLKIALHALRVWNEDPGNKWGKGNILGVLGNGKRIHMSDPNYPSIPASSNKCNIYVAEVLYTAVGKEFKVYTANMFNPGKSLPYLAADWAHISQYIRGFEIVKNPQIGDVWSNGKHMGIYLGEYNNVNLYVSARDPADAIGIREGAQQAHGIHIKELTPLSGVFRHYCPGC